MNYSQIPQSRIKINNFRAINSADIILDGITVIAGENGCGKSTLSKLLYFFYKTLNDYDLLVSQVATRELKDIYYFLEGRNFRNNTPKILSEEDLNEIISILEKLEIKLKESSDYDKKEKFKFMQSKFMRIRRNFQEKEENTLEESPEIFFEQIRDQIQSEFEKAFDEMNKRPANLFWNGFRKVFDEKNKPNLEIYEYEEQLISPEKEFLPGSLDIDKVIYIDTPMAIGIKGANEYWDDLNNLLETKDQTPLFQEDKYSTLSDLISTEIIKGEASFKNDILSNKFSFSRTDGKTFDLMECATGIQSFSILQILLKNGSLTNRTLLIIDEPESHLHPQWIVEYARVLVLLNKQLGVKVFLASHNPDMVRAIKQISEQQNTIENINFYLAEKSNTDFLYNYKHTDKDINTVFASFNKSLEAIDKYSGL